MEPYDLTEAVEKLDQRVARVEQILPTLASKEDLKPLATKEELREAVATLATKEDVRREGEESRRYMKILVEEVKEKIDLYAERVTALDERGALQHARSVDADAALDRRVTPLQATRRKRRG